MSVCNQNAMDDFVFLADFLFSAFQVTTATLAATTTKATLYRPLCSTCLQDRVPSQLISALKEFSLLPYSGKTQPREALALQVQLKPHWHQLRVLHGELSRQHPHRPEKHASHFSLIPRHPSLVGESLDQVAEQDQSLARAAAGGGLMMMMTS